MRAICQTALGGVPRVAPFRVIHAGEGVIIRTWPPCADHVRQQVGHYAVVLCDGRVKVLEKQLRG